MANGSQNASEVFDNLKLELRRGCLTLAVLTQLRTERYGYTLRKALADDGLEIDEGTLYPLLRRLESQGLLRSRWELEGNRPRRYYHISPQGAQVMRQLTAQWKSLTRALDGLLS